METLHFFLLPLATEEYTVGEEVTVPVGVGVALGAGVAGLPAGSAPGAGVEDWPPAECK